MLRVLAPKWTAAERESLGRVIWRMSLGALLNQRTDLTELRGQIRLLIHGTLARTATKAMADIA